jgi:hypothetical protein
VLELREKTPSQFYGDCKVVQCDLSGNAVTTEDPGDYYNDGKQCTIDFCQNGESVNMELPDGTPCPEAGEGYCHKGECVECVDPLGINDCKDPGLYCDYMWCVPISCDPNKCGGLCAPCMAGSGCSMDTDCLSNSCIGGMCQVANCTDGKLNDGETGIDCGSMSCGPCPDGQGCEVPENCVSGVCVVGKCHAPTCFDAVQNGEETGIDCGGECEACGP